jgi:uroporphyrinogen decarboxylase
MTSRERVLAAMRHHRPDRTPFDFSWGFAPAQLQRFAEQTGASDPDDYFGADTRLLRPAPTRRQTDFAPYLGTLPSGASVDEWGIGRRPSASSDAAYAHLDGFIYPLLQASSEADARAYPLPDIDSDYRYDDFAARVAAVQARGLAALAVMDCTIFEVAWYMRSMERLLLDFADGSPFASTLLDRITAMREVQARRYAESGADVICMGDDVGTQRGMLMSVRMWRTWLKPRLARVIAAARAVRPDVLVFFHSDGNVTAIVEDLVEIGVDILNPVQPECMDPVALRQRFGRRLCLWGTIGTQSTFPFGTPDDVRREVQARIETVGRDGGLFLAPTHMIEPEVPFANIVAFVDAVTSSR